FDRRVTFGLPPVTLEIQAGDSGRQGCEDAIPTRGVEVSSSTCSSLKDTPPLMKSIDETSHLPPSSTGDLGLLAGRTTSLEHETGRPKSSQQASAAVLLNNEFSPANEMNSPWKMVAGPSENDVAAISEVAHTFCDMEDDVDTFSADEMAEDKMAQVMVGIPDDISNTKAYVSSTRAEVKRDCTWNEEVIVRPTLDVIRNGAKGWKATAVGYLLGKRPYFHHLKEYALSVWLGLREVTGTTNGLFFFQFKSIAAMEDIIEGGSWLFQGQSIVLQKWKPGMVLRKLRHTQVPIWIKLRHLPMELWTEEGLRTVASGVGKPLYTDAITRAYTRLDFARVCVMLDVTSNLPKHISIMTPHEDGGESPYKVDVEYEWLPPKCTSCMTLGYSAKECALNKTKQAKSPIAIYVPKVGAPRLAVHERSRNHPTDHMREEQTVTRDTTSIPPRLPPTLDREMRTPSPTRVVEKQREGQESPRADTRPNREERGKALVIYNTFDALHLLDDITWASQRWSGEHIINMSYRALLAACVYHIWKERNLS
ncbi:UNVERIFIED_CONTAM: hypothetical protein Sindi_2905300, partial [Sesamum indicum]